MLEQKSNFVFDNRTRIASLPFMTVILRASLVVVSRSSFRAAAALAGAAFNSNLANQNRSSCMLKIEHRIKIDADFC